MELYDITCSIIEKQFFVFFALQNCVLPWNTITKSFLRSDNEKG